jgi:prephenate dehydrogenase
MKKISIIGLGLMGGSIGLALKARGLSWVVHGFARREETRQEAIRRGMVDEAYGDIQKAVRDADLVVFCTPILTIPDLARQIWTALKQGALVTDVGSTKSYLAQTISACQEEWGGACFIGSHPIAGSEQQGLDAARADLYEGAMTVITPEKKAMDSEPLALLQEFWKSLGSAVSIMSPDQHDAMMARTSHLPHVLASILALTVGRDASDATVGAYCGTGFRDSTRVAEGAPDVWHDIVVTNAAALEMELEACEQVLRAMKEAITKKEFERVRDLLAQGREARIRLLAS